MKHEIILNNEYVKFTDRDLLGQGGEGAVFAYKDWAVKLYHNTTDFQPRKIEELQKIRGNRVIKPVHVAYSKDNQVLGYAMMLDIAVTVCWCNPLIIKVLKCVLLKTYVLC